MRPDDLLQRMDALLARERDVVLTKTAGHGPGWVDAGGPRVDNTAFMQWATSAAHAIKLSFGEASDHYLSFRSRVDKFKGYFSTFKYCLGILRAARDDLAGGFMVSLQQLAAAEVFDDLLGMAKHLQESGYFLAAVAITGGVLEDALRKLHAKHLPGVQVPDQINSLNEALRKQGVYGQPQWREVQVWGDLRNSADHLELSNSASLKVTDEHGQPQPEIDPPQVARMIESVRDFIVRYLT